MASISNITTEELEELYINKQLSTYKIADQLGCDPKTVYYWLKKYRIKTRPIKKPPIRERILIDLYKNRKMSLKQIGILYKMSPAGILKRTKKFNIQLRTPWDANTGIKKSFDDSNEEKAYMIGFRLGDLGVRLSKKTKRVKVGSNTTKRAQILLMKSLFEKYSKVWISKPNKIGVMSFSTILDPSFYFLVPKNDQVEYWIKKNKQSMKNFIAGYVDAEGSFGIYGNRAKFRVGSFDLNILNEINGFLNKEEIKTCFNLDKQKGLMNSGHVLNKDFWRITVNEARSLNKLYQLIFPLLRHADRSNDFENAYKNIRTRLKNGTISL